MGGARQWWCGTRVVGAVDAVGAVGGCVLEYSEQCCGVIHTIERWMVLCTRRQWGAVERRIQKTPSDITTMLTLTQYVITMTVLQCMFTHQPAPFRLLSPGQQFLDHPRLRDAHRRIESGWPSKAGKPMLRSQPRLIESTEEVSEYILPFSVDRRAATAVASGSPKGGAAAVAAEVAAAEAAVGSMAGVRLIVPHVRHAAVVEVQWRWATGGFDGGGGGSRSGGGESGSEGKGEGG